MGCLVPAFAAWLKEGHRKKGKGFSHVTSPRTPLISELARSSGHLVAIKNRSDDASSFLGALLRRTCTAAGPPCACVRLTLLKERSGVDRVQFGIRAASKRVEAEASHSGLFSSLSPFSCLLPVTRPLWDELRVMPPPHRPFVCPPTSIRTHEPTNTPPRLHLNDSAINILQTNTHGGKLQRN